MKTLILAITAFIIALTAFVVSLQLKDTPKALGGFESSLQLIASTTATNFIAPDGTRTATTTLLTVGRAFEGEKLALRIEVNATGTAGTIYILPETSQNAITWFPIGNLNVATGASGANVQSIAFGTGSSTQLTFEPIGLGTTTGQFVLDNPVANLIRFRVWSTGTSSILLSAIKLLK